jgi:hypothetical protein
MGDEAEDFGAKLGTWYGIVRRARLTDAKKRAFALTVGSYADNDGTSVKAGIARLSTDCEMAYSTARRYLAWMREAGLIALARAGNGKKATRSDEYRLTIQPHTEKALNALGIAEYNDLIDGKRRANSDAEKGRRVGPQSAADASTALTHELSAVPREPEESTALTQRSERSRGLLRSPMGERPPKDKRSPPTGGAPPPDPRRPEPPTSSGARLDAEQEISAAHHPAQDRQRESLPHASARGPCPGEHIAPLIDFFTREVS